MRLFLSYQRYAALASGLAVACLYGLWAAWAHFATLGRVATVVLAAFVVVPLVRFSWHIACAWPRKLRATRLALRRIEAGRFAPKSIARYCEDPCFRVVAKEILRNTELSRREQRALLREFTAKAKEPAFVVYAPSSASPAVRVEGALFPTKPTQ